MIEAYKEFFKNYTNFYGRTSRRGFWLVYLMNVLIGIGVGVIGSIIAIGLNSIEGLLIPFVLAGGYALAILIPSIAITVRRLHDAGFSGFFYLIAFIPGVGGIALLILCLLESKPANQWGPPPEGYGQYQQPYGQSYQQPYGPGYGNPQPQQPYSQPYGNPQPYEQPQQPYRNPYGSPQQYGPEFGNPYDQSNPDMR